MQKKNPHALRAILGAGLLALATLAGAAPTVSLTSPTANSVFNAPATVTLAASATPSSGTTITKVAFYRGTTLIGSATSAPYQITWSNVAAGSYSLTAKATDSKKAVTTSAAVPILINKAPTVSLTAPTSSTSLTAPANITLTASASDTDGSIAKVEFYQGTTLIGTATSSPYTATWSNVAGGSYSLTAKATDNRGAVTTSSAVAITVNKPPVVTLTAPTANQLFSPGSAIALSATASDPDGTISKVEFYRGTTLIASDTSSPYSVTWSSVPQGSYTLTAKATDNKGAVTTSAPITILVDKAPTISLSSPTANQSFVAPANITLSANAADTDGTISRVEFYQGSTLLGSKTSAPYTLTWSAAPAGTYSLTAKAIDNQGAITPSAPVSITVLPNQLPSVSLTSPTANQSFVAPASIPLSANAADPDGTLAKVEFYQNNTLIGTALSAPYNLTWNNVQAGSYSLTAKAIDNGGGETYSSAVTISVGNPQPKLYYLHADHLNTPRLVTDEQNTVVWRNAPLNEPFGNNAVEEDPNGTGKSFSFNLRFPGQYADKETNTNYNYFRDYDPQTGRYVQSDPIGLRGGINTYSYVGGKPLRKIDPRGLNAAEGAVVGSVLFCIRYPNICRAAAAGVGAACAPLLKKVKDWFAQEKTPNEGEPGSTHTNPGSGQERGYGDDGKPDWDRDWDHDHGGSGVPHGHEWGRDENGQPSRGGPVPIQGPWQPKR